MTEKDDNTPGKQALTAMKDIQKEIIFKKPIGTPRKRAKEKVLDEDTYVEQIGKIIQRDFFPDLEKLKAQNEYLDAIERNDLSKMRELYMKYSGNRPPTQRIPSPATFETPANIHNTQVLEPETVPPQDDKKETKLSLDQFLNSHTSEDNHSFTEILIESEKKHQEKYSYLYNEEDKSEEDRLGQLALPSIEQQGALPIKPLNVDTWSYKNKNYIMYIPDGVPLTQEQEIELNKTKQEVVHSNTRLTLNPFNETQSKETISELAKTQAKILDGKIGVDGKELVTDSPKIRGFSFIKTPSPHPGLTDSPLMTWGEIEGTPFRLDGGDTPLPKSQGPSFKMAEPPRREQLALALAEKVGEKNRDRKQKAIDAARRRFTTPSPRSLNSVERLASMSPAARLLATSKLRLGTDLRFAYSPSPRTKRAETPKRSVTPKLNLGIRKVGVEDNLTDDLLKISVPKRQKAADFF